MSAKSQAKYVARRRASGLCGAGGCPNLARPGAYYCWQHVRTTFRSIMVTAHTRDELKTKAKASGMSIGQYIEGMLSARHT